MDDAKTQFLQTYRKLESKERSDFLKWIEEEFMVEKPSQALSDLCRLDTDTSESVTLNNAEAIMKAAAEEIRLQVPIEAVLTTEHIVHPGQVVENGDKLGDNCVDGCGDNLDDDDDDPTFDSKSSVHVDSFLYDDDAIDDLVDEGKFSRHYCRKCFSREVSLLNFISHSASIAQVKYVIQALIPVALEHLSLSSTSLRFLDIGSRFGPFLLGASLFSSSSSPSFSSIVGVEINKELCDLQRRVVEKFLHPGGVTPSVICADVKDCPDVVAQSDVIILHNVFQFFMPLDVQKTLWEFLFSTIRPKETLIITNPSLEDSFKFFKGQFEIPRSVQKVGVSPSRGFNFLRSLKTKVKQLGLDFEYDELEDFHVYHIQ